jgi:hypothetical protein
MSNKLRNRVRSSCETRHEFSSNFDFDQIIKRKIFEIEKLSKIRPESNNKGLKDNVYNKLTK